MTSYRIESQTSSNAYGEFFQVIQMEDGEDVYFVGTFTRRYWAEAWIRDQMGGFDGSNEVCDQDRDPEDESYRPISDCIPW